jgi:hypothetical protein
VFITGVSTYNSKIVRGNRSMIITLNNIINNDDDHRKRYRWYMCGNGTLPMICDSKREHTGAYMGGPIIDATDVVALNY